MATNFSKDILNPENLRQAIDEHFSQRTSEEVVKRAEELTPRPTGELISLLQQPTDSWLEYRDIYCDLVERFCDEQRISNPSLATWCNSELRPVRLQPRSCSETMMRGIVLHTMTAIELYSQCIGAEESANQVKESKLRLLSDSDYRPLVDGMAKVIGSRPVQNTSRATANVILVEDDHLQAQAITTVLKEHFPDLVEQHVSTEQEFCGKLSHIRGNPPDVIIINEMLRWTNPSPNMPTMPQEVIRGGYHNAGRRCERRLREHPETANTPVFLYRARRYRAGRSELDRRTKAC